MGEGPSGIFGELKRRRVVSSAAAYAAVSFVVLQLGEILFPAFGLAPAALRVLFAVLVALFPVALALSWVYDVTSTGLVRTDADAEGAPSAVLKFGVLASALALGAVGWWVVGSFEAPGARSGEASIAVLPFSDMSLEGDQGYLGDGFAEEILNLLAQVDGLQVAARTSSFAFREDEDIRAIADRLNVATVLEGSVRRDGDRVRVTAQLIDAETGFHLWSETYDRELDDLFAVQDEIAQAISGELVGQLTVGAASERYVASTAAQEAYWRGREQWNRRDGVGIPAAIRLFNEAVAADSLYAQAYAGLADSWALLPQVNPVQSAADALDRAEEFARRAIALDDELAEPHASLGLVLALRGSRIEALVELTRASQINPSYAPALHWRANVLAEMGRLQDARVDARTAAQVDPLSPSIATDHAYLLLWSGDLEAAAAEFERATELEFGFRRAVFGQALVALALDDEVDLQMALTEWAVMAQVPVAAASELTVGMMEHVRTGAAQDVPASLVAMGQAGRLDSGTVAAIHALLGDVDGTLRWLETSIEDRSWVDQYVMVNPVYNLVREEPAFGAFLSDIGASG